MSATHERPPIEVPIEPKGPEDPPLCDPTTKVPAALPEAVARLQAIHELVRSGNYHVPAAVIAERMVDRLMTEKRGRGD